MFDTKSYLEAIKSGKPRNIATMYPKDFKGIFDTLHEKGLIQNWPGNVSAVTLSKRGEAIL